jgi:kynurenine formamidase
MMITVKDLQEAMTRQQVTFQPGDAVIINTGWSRLWGNDNPRYVRRTRALAWQQPSG